MYSVIVNPKDDYGYSYIKSSKVKDQKVVFKGTKRDCLVYYCEIVVKHHELERVINSQHKV